MRPDGAVLGPHRYAPGELVQLGDVVEFDGHSAEVELVVDGAAVDADSGGLFRTHGPGVVLREPVVFGRVYLTSVHDNEELVFVGRKDQAGAVRQPAQAASQSTSSAIAVG